MKIWSRGINGCSCNCKESGCYKDDISGARVAIPVYSLMISIGIVFDKPDKSFAVGGGFRRSFFLNPREAKPFAP